MPKRKPFVVKHSNQQKIWSYIGRNRQFSISIVSLTLGIKPVSVQSFIWNMRAINYVRLVNKPTSHSRDWIYRCVRYTGVESPSISGSELFDHNTKEHFTLIKRCSREEIFNCILKQDNPFSIDDVSKSLGVTPKRVRLALKVLLDKEVVVLDSIKKHRKKLYAITKTYRKDRDA